MLLFDYSVCVPDDSIVYEKEQRNSAKKANNQKRKVEEWQRMIANAMQKYDSEKSKS